MMMHESEGSIGLGAPLSSSWWGAIQIIARNEWKTLGTEHISVRKYCSGKLEQNLAYQVNCLSITVDWW